MMGIFRFGHRARVDSELARAKNGGAAEPASKARTVGRVGAADPRMMSSRLGRERGGMPLGYDVDMPPPGRSPRHRSRITARGPHAAWRDNVPRGGQHIEPLHIGDDARERPA